MERVEGRPLWGVPPAPHAPAEPASEAWERAWAGDLGAARRLVEGRPDDVEKLGVLGATSVLERQSEAAVALLDRALALGGGQDLALFRTRALVHLGRVDEARRALVSLDGGEPFARRVLMAIVRVRSGHTFPTFRRWARAVVESQVHFNGLFSNELPALVGRAAVAHALESPGSLTGFLDNVLDRMAGNLGPSPTFAEVGPDGTRRFVRLDLPRLTRQDAVEALHSLRHQGPAPAEAALTAILRRNPRSIHAHCYRGELYLWLGRYDEAWRDFAAARRIEPPRWADIGMVAILTLTGRLQRARLMAVYAKLHFSSIPGGTLPVYRGMLRRRMGDLDGAIDDLGFSVAAKPSRIGARIELCLALRAAGRPAEAAEHEAVLGREAASLLVDVADARGLDWRREPARLVEDEVLEGALRAMRGNRSSSIVTWFDHRGELRVLEALDVLANEAQRALQARGARTGGVAGGASTPQGGRVGLE